MSGHKLGFVLALPAFLIGYTSGLQRAYYRHLGYLDNGNGSRYAGYKEDNTPYFVKHEVNDRRVV